jgi:hypothetical protein
MIRNSVLKSLFASLFTLVLTGSVTSVQAADRSAVYTVQAPRNVDSYQAGDVLASVTDPDGPIIKATMQGGVMPNGTVLNTITGAITVVQPSQLAAGIFNTTIRTKDALNGTTIKNITMIILADAEAGIVVLPVQHFLDYAIGDTLIRFIDLNGPIVSAVITSGTVPSGARLDSISGSILVTQPSALQSSSWNFTIKTTDATGGTTPTPVTFMFDPTNPLPVCWKTFDASRTENNQVTLSWSTACEQENARFVVMRSADGKNFQPIGEVNGAGNSSSSRSYLFTDRQPLFSNSYYKLQQVDLGGSYSYSPVRFVKADQDNTSFSVSPNPSTGTVQLNVIWQ